MMARWHNEMRGMENRGWARAEAAHGRAAQQAEEAMRKLQGYNDMDDAFQFGIESGLASEAKSKSKEEKAKAKGDAAKVEGDSQDKPLTIKMDLFRAEGSWEGESGSKAISRMFEVASDLYSGFHITLTDGNGITDAAKLLVKEVAATPKGGASFDFMDANNMKASGNDVSVLFAKTMMKMEGCGGDAAGCTRSGTNQTIIPERVQGQSMLGNRPLGFFSILAHELGHQFDLPYYGGDMRSGNTGRLMFENSSYRQGVRIPLLDQVNLRLGYLP